MDTKKFREIHVKFEYGEKLTDRELNELLSYYDDLVKALDRGHLPVFAVMQREAWMNQRRLQYMRNARDGK